jgi:succinate dehydrogenase/fumarate reductase flavoprotein subunit
VKESVAADFLAWVSQLLDPATTSQPLPNGPLRRRHIEMMDTHMGVLRDEAGMREVLTEVERARVEDLPRLRVFDPSRSYNYELRDVLEMFYRIEIESLATRAALQRTESRGTHFREDFPTRRDDTWLKNIVFWKDPQTYALRSAEREVEQFWVRVADLPQYSAQNSPWH